MKDAENILNWRRSLIAFPLFVFTLWALLIIESFLTANYIFYQYGEDVFDTVIREETFLSNWPFYRIPIEIGLLVGAIIIARWLKIFVLVAIVAFFVAFWLMGLTFRYYLFDLLSH